jgi:hypothetical protein
MARTPHTPGPWRAERERWPSTPNFAIQAELPCINGLAAWLTLANVFIPDDTERGYTDDALNPDVTEANALLMASAPDLLKENRRLREALADIKAHVEERNFYSADAGLVFRLAEDALNPPPERKPDLDEEIVF